MNRTRFALGARLWRPAPSADPTAQELQALRLYHLKEAETLTGIRVRRLKAFIREGRLVGTRLSKNDLRVSAADLATFFQTCKTTTIL